MAFDHSTLHANVKAGYLSRSTLDGALGKLQSKWAHLYADVAVATISAAEDNEPPGAIIRALMMLSVAPILNLIRMMPVDKHQEQARAMVVAYITEAMSEDAEFMEEEVDMPKKSD